MQEHFANCQKKIRKAVMFCPHTSLVLAFIAKCEALYHFCHFCFWKVCSFCSWKYVILDLFLTSLFWAALGFCSFPLMCYLLFTALSTLYDLENLSSSCSQFQIESESEQGVESTHKPISELNIIQLFIPMFQIMYSSENYKLMAISWRAAICNVVWNPKLLSS